jgi:hypothetical protein
MDDDFQEALRQVAKRVTELFQDGAEAEVVTNITEVGAANAQEVARTLIKVDGDITVTVPVVRDGAGRLQLDETLLALHQRNVTTAIEYRARMLDALANLLNVRERL